MNVGVIVHSSTGNTLSVAEKIRGGLAARGHAVCLERVTAVNDDPQSAAGKQLDHAPDTGGYDALIFAAPVWGFSLCAVMRAYLAQVANLSGIKTGLFVTQHFPCAWMGGSRAIRQMETACREKGAAVFCSGIINWTSKKRSRQIEELAGRMCAL